MYSFGHVHPRDRDRAVVVHLLRELARQLDRLDVGAEGTAEDALEQRLDLALDRAEHAHRPKGNSGSSGVTRASARRAPQVSQTAPTAGSAAILGSGRSSAAIRTAPKPASSHGPRRARCGSAAAARREHERSRRRGSGGNASSSRFAASIGPVEAGERDGRRALPGQRQRRAADSGHDRGQDDGGGGEDRAADGAADGRQQQRQQGQQRERAEQRADRRQQRSPAGGAR